MPRAIAIVGCTASGKSALALEMCKRHHGELVSMDSMQLYRGMDIGTAKPTKQEQAEVVHHMIDVVDPCES
ncbi:MAG: tRNA (adenosine(37)-N6)-dimethylallyltransferase MiaA, partial [Clostridia bacterium]|nr:tRNA (adenosine(37)-N6)-dimethylallyltransferase MiaA [Clostridia bacterium]